MNEAAIRAKIRELTEVLTTWPLLKAQEGDSAKGTYLPVAPAEGPMLVDMLDQVRLQVKYLMFDLEATRRENRYLRQMLDSRHRRDRDDEVGKGPEKQW